MANNPFTPMFGTIPAVMVGREDIVNDMRGVFTYPTGNPNSATLLVGARGTGKTALLGKISQEAGIAGWIAVNTSASEGMLEDILIRTRKSASHLINTASKRKIKSASLAHVGGISFEENDEELSNWRSKMEDLLIALEEKNSGLLITVDEIDPNSKELSHLASVFQHFSQEERSVALVLAGLPMNADSLVSGKSTSFLRRARRRELQGLTDMQTRSALKETAVSAGRNISADALEYASKAIGGFPYMLQLVGYEMWMQSEGSKEIAINHAKDAVSFARPELEENVYGATLRELSDRDREFLVAMIEDDDESNMSDIASRLGVSSSYANNYKRRLMREGVIEQTSRSGVRFSMPGFREYVVKTL